MLCLFSSILILLVLKLLIPIFSKGALVLSTTSIFLVEVDYCGEFDSSDVDDYEFYRVITLGTRGIIFPLFGCSGSDNVN